MLRGRPPTVSASIPSKLTVIRTNCDHILCRGCERVLVCVIACVMRAYCQKGLRSYLFKSCTLRLMSDLQDSRKDRLMNA